MNLSDKDRTRSARKVALSALNRGQKKDSYINILWPSILDKNSLSDKDSAFATELVYGITRRLLTLDNILSARLPRYAKLPLEIRNILRMALYQSVFMDKIPAYAIADESVSLVSGKYRGLKGLVNSVCRKITEEEGIRFPAIPSKNDISGWSHHYSCPEWIIEKWQDELGREKAATVLERINSPAPAALRVNPLKCKADDVFVELERSGLNPAVSPYIKNAFRVERPGIIEKLAFYREGKATLQSEASMLAGIITGARPGERLLDLCAAPGRKATQLAEMMGNKGELIAVDINHNKLRFLQSEADRLGISIIKTIEHDARGLEGILEPASFDRVLLDPPCSDLGYLARRPDARWRKKPKDIEELARVQKELIDSAARHVKPGGILTYSTCTISRQENDEVVDYLLEKSGFELLDARRMLPFKFTSSEERLQFLPGQVDLDGMFIALLRKL